MIGIVPSRTGARIWHALTALTVLLAVGTQLALVIGDVNIGFGPSNAPLGQRLFEFFSYFTVQSNIFVGIAAGLLAARPDRDGAYFRVLRIAAMFGITVTLLMYHFVLSPLANFTGVASASNIGLHYVVPIFAIVGWILFGPHPRVSWKALFLALIWPGAFIIVTVVQGAVTGFYPYPFVNIDVLGFPTVLINGVGIVALLLAVGSAYKLIDWLISRPKKRTT
ncbi:Pr6Pr family membrane protein [Microbacterium sp. LWO13-1.2]|uniref:Pr6Pr family membrane protein n=1 Tax=Microbacterium sp. LWO13-1.2 TaxID=3135262 RepID=UPI00313977AC